MEDSSYRNWRCRNTNRQQFCERRMKPLPHYKASGPGSVAFSLLSLKGGVECSLGDGRSRFSKVNKDKLTAFALAVVL